MKTKLAMLLFTFAFLSATCFSNLQKQDKKVNLQVKVVDIRIGAPVEGVIIKITEQSPPSKNILDSIVQEGESGAKGRITFSNLNPGAYSIEVIKVPSTKFAIEALADLSLNRDTELEIKLPPSASVSGKIILSDKQKLTEPIVRAIQKNGKATVYFRSIDVAKDGAYRVDGLNGLLPVFLLARAKGSHAKIIEKLKLAPLDESKNIDFSLTPIDEAAISVTGKLLVDDIPKQNKMVMFSSTLPINGFVVAGESVTNSEGKYTIYGLPAGNYTISVQDASGIGRVPEDFPSQEVTVESGQTATVDFNVKTKKD